MGHRNNLNESSFAQRRQRFDVAVEHRLEGLLGFPIRMVRRHGSHPIHGKHDLKIHRLFRPQGAVMIKSRDAVLGFDIIGAAIAGHTVDKVDYRLSCWHRRSKTKAIRSPVPLRLAGFPTMRTSSSHMTTVIILLRIAVPPQAFIPLDKASLCDFDLAHRI